MSNKKKITIALIISVVVIAIIVTVLHFLKKKNADSKVIDVYSVSEVGQINDFFDGPKTLDGSVSVNMEQKIYPISNQKIKEIHVKEGDVVKAGDIILEYDTTAQSLSLEKKRAEVELARTEVIVAERELEELKNTVPIEDMPQPEATTEAPITEVPTTETPTTEAVPKKDDKTDKDTPVGTATDADTNNAANPAKEGNDTAINADKTDVNPSATDNTPVGEGDPNNKNDQPVDQGEADDTIPEEEQGSGEQFYTRDELNKMISDKQNEIKNLNTSYQLKEVEYEIMENQLSNGQVTANFDGVVKTVMNEEDAINENTAMIVLSGTSGYTVNASIGELSLGKISIGMEVELLCYDTGMPYTGKVTDIQTIPISGRYGGDTLETYYPVTIIIDDADDLKQDQYMEITLPNSSESSNLYILMPFIKRDNDNYYVLKEENGRLKKVYVETGKIMWGEIIQIKSGLSMDDYVAFPYASDVEEGMKTKHANFEGMYY
ncbi:MAG: HlyD family efflux transporter periplasmic adaptor subunit [Lachnospiraceae bacterium]|nr:HlyD family efflux transporter periplasmic adaptor subunit [Lachnospiraceae bacterium]